MGSRAFDPCLEAEAQHDAISEVLGRKRLLLGIYTEILGKCGSGKYSLACVSRTEFADEPQPYLAECQQRMGPQPALSGAVCRYAKAKQDDLASLARRYGSLESLMKKAERRCDGVPMDCITMAHECLDDANIQRCFSDCIRTGFMNLLTTTRAPKMIGQ
mmetsp:Transcript_62719/g.194656  ORF Transcript_62719/g.194656 Transcript_62719/m.194656 type:complete len:160 (+) Transcript_62719:268-747(+)